MCSLSHINYANFAGVAKWDRFFRQPANIGITRSSMHWCVRKKNPSLTISVYHHSTSLVMQIGDPWDGFFHPDLTHMMNS